MEIDAAQRREIRRLSRVIVASEERQQPGMVATLDQIVEARPVHDRLVRWVPKGAVVGAVAWLFGPPNDTVVPDLRWLPAFVAVAVVVALAAALLVGALVAWSQRPFAAELTRQQARAASWSRPARRHLHTRSARPVRHGGGRRGPECVR